ncbi:MAG TPA: hypothetical protein VFR21_19990 [Bradyrhizobium sp.]|nr:hypothetical protein [Bradyrhizobium sp.]
MTLHGLLNIAVFFALSYLGGVVIYRLPISCKKRVDCGTERSRKADQPAESA